MDDNVDLGFDLDNLKNALLQNEDRIKMSEGLARALADESDKTKRQELLSALLRNEQLRNEKIRLITEGVVSLLESLVDSFDL